MHTTRKFSLLFLEIIMFVFYICLFLLNICFVSFAFNFTLKGFQFLSGRKSPKDKKEKSQSPGKDVKLDDDDDNDEVGKKRGKDKKSYTKSYEYTESDPNLSPTRKKPVGGFRYDEDPSRRRESDGEQRSPNSQARRATGLAFNYAPGDEDKLKETAEKLAHGELSPKTREKLNKGELSPGTKQKLIQHGNLSPKTKAKLASTEPSRQGNRSYSPNKGLNLDMITGAAGKYKNIENVVKPDESLGLIGHEAMAGLPTIKPNKKKRVKIMIITARMDPKSKKLDFNSKDSSVNHSFGVHDTETNKVQTPVGLIDINSGQIERINKRGEKETVKGLVDSKTGAIQVPSNEDDSLGQVIFVAPLENPVVEIVCVTSKLDGNGQVDILNGDVEHSRGVYNIQNGFISTKYGKVNIHTGDVIITDPKSGKIINKKASINEGGQFTVRGILDPKTGKQDPNQGHLLLIGQQIEPIVEVQSVVGKLDKNGLLDPKTIEIDTSSGQLDAENCKINTKYGQLDLLKRTIAAPDPKTGKTEVKDYKIDPFSGQIILKNQINPKTLKPDRDINRFVSLRVVKQKPKSNSDGLADVKIDPKTNQIWTQIGRDPKTNEPIYQTSSVDPSSGVLTLIISYFNPKTQEFEKQRKMDPNFTKVDKNGQIFSATGDLNDAGEPFFASSHVDPQNGKIITKLAKVDKTGKLVIVKIFLISNTGSGQPIEISPEAYKIDPVSNTVAINDEYLNNLKDSTIDEDIVNLVEDYQKTMATPEKPIAFMADLKVDDSTKYDRGIVDKLKEIPSNIKHKFSGSPKSPTKQATIPQSNEDEELTNLKTGDIETKVTTNILLIYCTHFGMNLRSIRSTLNANDELCGLKWFSPDPG
jgi:band 4.1-like protein 1/2/3